MVRWKGKKNIMSPLEKLLDLPVWTIKQSGRWLTKHLSYAIEHLPDKEELIFKVFKNSVVTLLMIKKSQKFRKTILSTLECRRKSKWTTFLDNLSLSNDLNTLTTELLQILLQELISKEKGYQPFWIPAYKELSEKLLLPTGTDFVDLDSNSSSSWSQKQVEKSLFLTSQTTSHVNKNSPKICCPSSMYSLADKWEKEVIQPAKLKTLKIKIYPTKTQKKVLNEFIDTSRYVYNRTLELVKRGLKPNFQNLRDILVTAETKKGYPEYKDGQEKIKKLRILKQQSKCKDANLKLDSEIKDTQQCLRNEMKTFPPVKNIFVHDFELSTPKDIRSNAVERCCNAFTSGFSNLKRGNIRFFNLKYKKKSERTQSIEMTPKLISICNNKLKIVPDTLKEECFLRIDSRNERRLQNLTINNNVDIVRHKNQYYVHLCVDTKIETCTRRDIVASVDPGVRTLATLHSSSVSKHQHSITEYKHRRNLFKKLNKKIDVLKSRRKRTRKKQFNKIEKKKNDIIDRIHWDFINHLLKHNDVIYFGDIKSHDIVKQGCNKTLNRELNDLKLFLLKQRLAYKASLCGKVVLFVREHYTTKTCSSCGIINDNVGSKEIFECKHCNLKTGRDMNAAKNIKMKGFLT